MNCDEWRKKATHRIVIQRMSNTADAYGGENVSWITQSTVWATITPMTGYEIFRQDMAQSKVRSKMIIRYQAALKDTETTGAYRVSYDGRVFPIKYSVNVDESMKDEGTQYQILYCEEGQATEQ